MKRVLILGCGFAGAAVARLARLRGTPVLTSVRSDANAVSLRAAGFDVLQLSAVDGRIAEHVDANTHVVVAFPPDGATDARAAAAMAHAGAVTYLSSTGVYGDHRGVVDDATALPASPSPRSTMLLAAEAAYRAVGGVALRCPALYGRDRGLHMRVLRGEHSIPGDGTRYLSRIHVDDLAQCVLASAGVATNESLVVGDCEPAPHIDVVRYICATYNAPMPRFVPLESVHESLRADRRVDASRTLARFGVTCFYPTYREGMSPSAAGFVVSSSSGAGSL